ncbi:MAG: hypothetical protein IRZ28_09775 [Steroidobacteraceae bacterium]|nr:hypothetical protein [Steroidobacteraceae bacterium]
MNSLTSALTTVPTLLNIGAVLWLLWLASGSRAQHAKEEASKGLWGRGRAEKTGSDRD